MSVELNSTHNWGAVFLAVSFPAEHALSEAERRSGLHPMLWYIPQCGITYCSQEQQVLRLLMSWISRFRDPGLEPARPGPPAVPPPCLGVTIRHIISSRGHNGAHEFDSAKSKRSLTVSLVPASNLGCSTHCRTLAVGRVQARLVYSPS